MFVKSYAIPSCDQSFPTAGMMCPRTSDLKLVLVTYLVMVPSTSESTILVLLLMRKMLHSVETISRKVPLTV